MRLIVDPALDAAERDAHLFLKRAHLLAALGTSRRAAERQSMADMA